MTFDVKNQSIVVNNLITMENRVPCVVKFIGWINRWI